MGTRTYAQGGASSSGNAELTTGAATWLGPGQLALLTGHARNSSVVAYSSKGSRQMSFRTWSVASLTVGCVGCGGAGGVVHPACVENHSSRVRRDRWLRVLGLTRWLRALGLTRWLRALLRWRGPVTTSPSQPTAWFMAAPASFRRLRGIS